MLSREKNCGESEKVGLDKYKCKDSEIAKKINWKNYRRDLLQICHPQR